MTTSAVTSSSATEPATGSTAALSLKDAAEQKDMFLKLMMAQLKNQDPMNPTDSSTFLGQLAQYTQLEQTMYMRQGIEDIDTTLKDIAASQAAAASPAAANSGAHATQETK